ncbi:SRPBCC family protein [Streptomyces crystallinus]|uniref:SRPBCC family protein n=1 Tax=Streptomyces crystallinus TaxID=68191 RepID=A0ABP3QT15_9ACTN
MGRERKLEESIVVDAAPEAVYRLVAHLPDMGRWSPECRRVWVPRTPVRAGTRFIGLNRRGPFVWFTTGRVSAARVGEEFTFDVGIFGLPIARWGYRFAAEGSGTRVTETWEDRRTGPGARLTNVLGTVFAGTNPERRIAVNRHGMRTTLARIAQAATVS